ncbi:hypothetical protein BLX24_12765 [Arsenicibacter rosenii]|uniref:Viral A-type inclusion protein n=2 Tax=Arsenicibacter rosenii TaxID=1750698 RepID=A0A1S2VK16_9BACT|nr:hypothetical protein BLX24_12765 [Arsenicibacter rosenii]
MLLAFTACQSKTEQHEHHHGGAAKVVAEIDSVGQLEQEILAIHDSIMPQMSELMRLKKTVSAKIEATKDEAVKKGGLAVSGELEQADQAMMSWMNQYNGDTLKKLQPAQAMAYLRDQHGKVTEMRRTMHTSIDHAKAYVQP